MAILGRNPGSAVRDFRDHVGGLLSKTLTQQRLVQTSVSGGDKYLLSFRQNASPAPAVLRSRFGEIELYLSQVCEAVPSGIRRKYRVRTVEYQYTITPEGSDEPAIRWEYVKEPEDADARWSRHHIQGPLDASPLAPGRSYNDLHVPTGYVLLEDVIRFCIHDLGVPPQQENWHKELAKSERRFKDEFTQ